MIKFLVGIEKLMPAIFAFATISLCSSAEVRKTTPPGRQADVESDGDAGGQVLLDLYQSHKILAKAEYAKIRHVFAARFEKEHNDAIRGAFGEPGSPFRQWLGKRTEIKEEFFLALDPEHDDLPLRCRSSRSCTIAIPINSRNTPIWRSPFP